MKIYDSMKRAFFISLLSLSVTALSAQTYYVDSVNPEIYRHAELQDQSRKEIILPEVNGYTIFKADLHTHTIFSDGHVDPDYRVMEAWQDGLDIMAVTEHLEYRPREEWFVEYTQKYNGKKYKKAINNRLGPEALDKNGIMVDLNYPVYFTQKAAKSYDILVIPGLEITRNGTHVGHFNALFTTDNNIIFDPDPVQSVRNAKAQGALVMHNHPGWRRTDLVPTETEAVLYAEGLIDGIEVMNGYDFYPGIVDRAREKGCFVAASSDVHNSTAIDYRLLGYDRPMTLVLAKEKSLEAIREALQAKRTLSYGFGTICGEEQLLKDFFAAGIKVKFVRNSGDGKNVYVSVTNMTSLTYLVKTEGKNRQRLAPFHTIYVKTPKSSSTLDLMVMNMFYSKEKHPVVSLPY